MKLKQRLSQPQPLLAPGVCNAWSALGAEQAGVDALNRVIGTPELLALGQRYENS